MTCMQCIIFHHLDQRQWPSYSISDEMWCQYPFSTTIKIQLKQPTTCSKLLKKKNARHTTFIVWHRPWFQLSGCIALICMKLFTYICKSVCKLSKKQKLYWLFIFSNCHCISLFIKQAYLRRPTSLGVTLVHNTHGITTWKRAKDENVHFIKLSVSCLILYIQQTEDS